jgi:hypothetical protein
MGYLDNSSITVDAILTKKGRELLARGRNEFNITQFALADDEIDYDLWNPDHPLGTAFYGTVIENMPLTEAVPDDTQVMRYKLVTLPKTSTRIPVVSIGGITATTLTNGQTFDITPNTTTLPGSNATFGYTAILSDSSVGTLSVRQAAPRASQASIPASIGDSEAATSVSVTGISFTFAATASPLEDKIATIAVIGNETGGRAILTVTVKQSTTATVGNLNQ